MNKENIYDAIKQQILVGHYKSGDLLKERVLMEKYKIGRTPLREIFLRLQKDGLIRRFSRLGTVVAPLDIKKLFDVGGIRGQLEGMVATLAASRISGEALEEMRASLRAMEDAIREEDISSFAMEETRLHNILYCATGNLALKEFLATQYSLFMRAWFIFERTAQDLTEQLEHWQDMYQALCEKDEEKVMASNMNHCTAFFNRLQELR